MEGVQIIELPKILDPRGNLTFVEMNNHIPFEIKRSYWTYDVRGGELITGNALKSTDEFIIALSGSFDVVVNDGGTEKLYSLNRSYYGLFIPAMTWCHLENFSTNSLCLCLASEQFKAEDSIDDLNLYKSLKV